MADHYSKSLEHLDEVHVTRRRLLNVYAAGNADRGTVAQLHQDIGVGLKLAAVHAQLALVVATQEARLVS